MCLLFAATYPKRTLGLILYDPITKSTATPGYPFTSWTPAQIEAAVANSGHARGSGGAGSHYSPLEARRRRP